MAKLLALITLAGGASCATVPVGDVVAKRDEAKAEAIHLVLVATNDWHGQLFADEEKAGGAEAFFSELTALREAFRESVLWVDAGDMLSGEWVVDEQRGQLVVDAFSLMGLDFAAIGEGDFAFGPLETSEGADAQGTLKASMSRAKFPWDAANIYLKADGSRPAWLGTQPHMVERQGIHIGFIGLTTPSTPHLAYASHLRGLYFGDMAWAAQREALALREKGAEVVVLVVHAGGECQQWGDPKDITSCNLKSQEIGELLEALPEGLVDVVVAGHTHKPLGHFFKRVPVVQTRGMGKHFALVHLYWEPTERRLLRKRTQVQTEVPICTRGGCREGAPPGGALKADAALMALLAPAAQQSHEKRQEMLGIEVGEHLSLGDEEASPLGEMWAESLWQATQADVVLLNRSAFSSDLAAGALSAGRLYDSMPGESRVVLVRFSGADLKRLMQLAYGQTRFRFDIAGAELEITCSPSNKRLIKTHLVERGGKKRELEEKKFYWVAMPDFLVQGGNALEGVWAGASPRPMKWRKGMREEVLHFWRQRQKPLLAVPKPRILQENVIGLCESSE